MEDVLESMDTPDDDRGDGTREFSSKVLIEVLDSKSGLSNDGGGVKDLKLMYKIHPKTCIVCTTDNMPISWGNKYLSKFAVS